MPVSSSSIRMPNCEIASIIAFCSGVLRKQRMLKVGQQQSEQRRAEQQPGDQLPHNRRLLEPQHGFAEQAADDQQRQDLRDEDDFGGAFGGFPRGERRLDGEHRQRERQAEPAAADLGHRWRRPYSGRRFEACNNPMELGKFQSKCNCKLFATNLCCNPRKADL